jgi:hypothetical protein
VQTAKRCEHILPAGLGYAWAIIIDDDGDGRIVYNKGDAITTPRCKRAWRPPSGLSNSMLTIHSRERSPGGCG